MTEREYREKPQYGTQWLGNAEVFEQHRCSCLAKADQAEELGEAERAAELRRSAENWRKRRDEDQRTMLQRYANRAKRR